MPILLKEDYKYPLPKLVSVEQIFDHLEIEDVEEKTKREFEKEEIRQKIHIGDKVAIAVGSRGIQNLRKIIYVFLTIFLYLLKCPQSLILSALRAFCFCGKPHISRSIFLYFRYQAWLKSW